MEYKTVFLDLDGTLKTDGGYTVKEGDEGIVTIKGSRGNDYSFLARPHAKEFCAFLASKYLLYLTTLSVNPYSTNALVGLGVRQYFHGIVDAKKMMARNFPQVKYPLLWIDNDAEGVRIKRNAKGMSTYVSGKEDVWIVSTYNGYKDDNELLGVMDELKKE